MLTGQDNRNLLKIARSRGINVTAEAQPKPGVADNKIINKIIDNFSPDELDELRNKGLEVASNRHQFGDIGPEAWKTLGMETLRRKTHPSDAGRVKGRQIAPLLWGLSARLSSALKLFVSTQ